MSPEKAKPSGGSRWIDRAAAMVRLLGRAELAVAVILVFFIAAAVTAEVFSRYVLGSSLIWVEEAATISFIWMTLLGAAVAAKMNRHIWIETFGKHLGPRGQVLLAAFGRAFVLFMALLIAVYATGYVETQNRSTTVSLPVNVPRGWVFAIPTAFAMASIALTQALLLLDSVVHTSRGRHRAPLRILEG